MPQLIFQTLCWYGEDVIKKDEDEDDDDTEGNDDGSPQIRKTYTISVYGKTEAGESVCLHIPFQPYFFIELPSSISDSSVRAKIFQNLKHKLRPKGMEKDLVSYRIIARKKFYGFTNGQPYKFVALVFSSISARNFAAAILKRDFELFESNVDPILRFLHQRDLESTGWVQIDNYQPPDKYVTRCDIEGTLVNTRDINKLTKTAISPLVIASFDIECISASGGFPDPRDDQSPIIQIATAFQRYGESSPYRKTIFCLKETNQLSDGTDLYWFDDERDLIVAWAECVCKEHTDVLIGYNIWGFDMEYVFERAKVYGGINDPKIKKFFMLTGKHLYKPTEPVKMTLSSSAYGNNEWVTFKTPGVLQIDLMQVIKKEHKLDSYKLDHVAGHFLDEHKIDLAIPEMFRLYKGSASDRQRIAEYCVRDTELPLKLMHKLAILPNMVEMAKATHVPIEYLIPRGQQIKVFSQILKKTRERGYLCPTRAFVTKEEKYEGATVLDACTGAHWSVITCLDFASLYPSIMRAYNMCHSTVVLDQRFDNIPGINYFEKDGVRFASNVPGILPELLKDLADFRKQAKKDMAIAKQNGDKFAESLYNGKQLAYKVSMNSMYGFCGASNGFLPCIPIASSVTTVGRSMILKTKEMIEANFKGSKIIYGDTDSVMINFGVNDLSTCFKLGEEAAAMVTASFPRPIELTFEKCYCPYLLFSKKRYAGLYYTNPHKPDKLDCKGIQLVRRDNCRLVKQVLEKVLNLIMYEKDTDGAINFIRSRLQDLYSGHVDINDLVLSKTLKASTAVLKYQVERKCPKCGGFLDKSEDGDRLLCSGKAQSKIASLKDMSKTTSVSRSVGCGFTDVLVYKNSAQPHITVALKQEARNPGSGPNSGDRVPFVYIEDNSTAKKNAILSSECAEDPKHYIDSQSSGSKLYIDYRYYVEHQLRKPILDLFEIVIPNTEERIFHNVGEQEYEAARQQRIRKTINKQNKQCEITDFFKTRKPC